jgi:hypothetical protein
MRVDSMPHWQIRPRKGTNAMPSVRQCVFAASLVALLVLPWNHLHAEDAASESDASRSHGTAIPLLLDSGAKQSCNASSFWCPDAYCRKCPPCIRPPECCGYRTCYVPKCAPCICPPVYCGSCDCYDAKCPPPLKMPGCFPDFYKCPPPECCVAPASKWGEGKGPWKSSR